ncbi:BTAD domain-containing putative transcriptional regulator [Micromonospora sp. LOL_025]|uniref:AfsR/SARP family transcriptional regulator n=1 Tax=Micromonospora sp. LOL_025 TaxID=3345413 RepID=UPI003A85DD4F
MRFRVLGLPYIEKAAGVAGRRTTVLASMLALNANKHVSLDRLIDAVWEERPPATAREQVQNCISILRRSLSDGPTAITIQRIGASYQLNVDANEVDAHRFERDYRTATTQAAAGDLEAGANLMRSALALWRGPALDGMESAELRAHACRLNDMRTTATQRMLELKLELECPNEAVPELRSLTRLHPLHEPYMLLLTEALLQRGQHREALSAYDAFARHLAAELGANPGSQARARRADILAAFHHSAPSTEARNGRVSGPRDLDAFAQAAELLAAAEKRPESDLLGHLERAVLHIRAASVLLASADGN